MDLLRFVTAGSVDDGKSTLIGRLLHDANALYDDHVEALRRQAGENASSLEFSWITDGLRAEREQGITIDVAYRYFSTARRRFIVADTPGHEQYTRNMATGASTADLAVVLIDARLGVLTQSKRHGFIASLLGVPHLVVAVNKMDLMGYSQEAFVRIREEYLDFVTRLGFSEVVFIPISALKGDNVVNTTESMPWYSGVSLLNHLENAYIAGDRNLIDFRFPVQHVVRDGSDFRGLGGQVVSGIIRAGDEVVVLSSGRRSKVSRIVTYDGDLDYAFAPMSITITLENDIDVGRGDCLSHTNNIPRRERSLDAMIIWMSQHPLEVGGKYVIKHAATTTNASCAEVLYKVDPDTLDHEECDGLQLNEIGRVRITLFRPLHVDDYRRNRANGRFIMIDPVSNETVGAGLITDQMTAQSTGLEDATRIVSTAITWQQGRVDSAARARVLKQEPATVWLTGLSGSGKSSIAFEVEHRLLELGHACYVLDGDNIRHGLSRDLGFNPTDRTENIRRVAEVARLFNEAGLIVITAFISPYANDRETARQIIGTDRFIEAYLNVDLATCERRDPRGLYARARSGQIAEFTGISAPYEPPASPAVSLDTGSHSIDECVQEILRFLSPRLR